MKKIFVILLLPLLLSGFSPRLQLKPNIKISKSDYQSLSLNEIVILRNSIFAHYGYIFKSKTMGKYYSDSGWYKPNKNFKYSMLTKNDQYNVRTLANAEKLLKKKLIEKLRAAEYSQKRYFLKGKITRRIQETIEKGMLYYCMQGPMTKSLAIERKDVQSINFGLQSVSLSKEVTKNKLKAEIKKKKAKFGSSFEYWIGYYDQKGVLRKLDNIQYDSNYYDRKVYYYFNEKGRLLYAYGNLVGTVGFSLYYQYLDYKITWIELLIKNVGAAGVNSPGTMKKFYL